MRGKRRFGLLLAVTASLLAVPTIDLAAAPAPAEVVDARVELTSSGDGHHVGRIEVPDAASVTAVLDGREVEIRWRTGDTALTPWRPLSATGEHAPDPGTTEAAAARGDVSEPMWLGSASEIEVRADAPGPVELEVVRLPGDRSYTAEPSVSASAEAFSLWPPIIPRYRWDPNGDCVPSRPSAEANVARRIYVHHTVIFPHYDESEADDALRAMCIGHVRNRGFSDLGYNFVIDQYGRIYQGREGGILRAVVGAHASGFNHGSIGIAIIGDFEEHRPPAAAINALDRLVAWLSDLHGIEPYDVSDHVSTGGETTRFVEGDVVALPSIVGHRDTGLDTLCPGEKLYEYVRGGHPIAPRVRNLLEADYGWGPTDRRPPPAGEPRAVAPTAGRHDHGPVADRSVFALVGAVMGELRRVSAEADH